MVAITAPAHQVTGAAAEAAQARSVRTEHQAQVETGARDQQIVIPEQASLEPVGAAAVHKVEQLAPVAQAAVATEATAQQRVVPEPQIQAAVAAAAAMQEVGHLD